MKNDTTFVRMRSGDHLGDAKMSKTNPAKGRNITSILHVPLWLERHQSVFTHVRWRSFFVCET